ncbi:(d)CMP kinase [Phragmitibacter flavus]|uniref:Cytidylate kinase n=1 Tax=Phragmitibacter flavus TaxID=2576071 RepID=A0A5R8KAU6_9BACT|nr:(d)CMP kinase [Phragmitibacter flavus]TLD69430.1 (d)CMP kinase [Phragmitibacter flavus]
MSEHHVIAMDGPAASGKSSVAGAIADRFGWVFVNTGNMYRAATLAALRAEVDVNDKAAVIAAVDEAEVGVAVVGGRSVVTLKGEAVEDELKDQSINLAVSHVAAVPEVREKLVAMQRDLLQEHSLVMEGRDIGTVVFPETPWKFYIDASEEVRASRRGLQGQADAVSERDRLDSTRKVAPLKAAADAVVIDSTELSLEQVVEEVLAILGARGLTVKE